MLTRLLMRMPLGVLVKLLVKPWVRVCYRFLFGLVLGRPLMINLAKRLARTP
ncbi:MAG: hypothetical protein ACKO34_02190 [Vampirovibrionales bacterium]